YNISFVQDGFKYTFTSNGNTWSWNYTYTGGADTAQSTTDYTDSYNQASTQSVSANNQASTSNVKAVSAPVQKTSSYSNYSAR
ncbi:transglycosylase, partial [Staphylococcus capitis]